MLFNDALLLTEGTTTVLTSIEMELEFAVLGLAQVALDVITRVTASPLTKALLV
jgi:hypothetical protein